MEERRFVIKECPVSGDANNFSITLTELKHRIWTIQKDQPTYLKAIDILLHGESPCLCRDWSSRVCEHGTKGCIVYHSEAKPKQTYDEWVEKCPNSELKAWFREMPRE